jgi:uncharacterized membrane protein YdbT with pleckstrin-like domain
LELHEGEQVVFEGRPSWRALLSVYIGGTVATILVGVIVALIAGATIGVGVGVGLFVAVLVIGFFKRLGTRYMLSNQRLYIRRGLLAKRVQQTRIDRIQNVNTEQSLLERVLRVGTVDFDTAGTGDADFRFEGIANPDAVVRAVDVAQRETPPGIEQPL